MSRRQKKQLDEPIDQGEEEDEDDELMSEEEEEEYSVRGSLDCNTGSKKRRRTVKNNRAEFESSSHDDNKVPIFISSYSPVYTFFKSIHNSDDELTLYDLKKQLDTTSLQIQHMSNEMSELAKEVSNIKQLLIDIKNTVKRSIQHSTLIPSSTSSISTHDGVQQQLQENDLLIPAKFAPIQGPFPKYTQMDRTLPRPSAKEVAETLGGKEHSLQFTSNLYVDLIEKVLGPQEENQHLDYRAMVKEAIMITKAVVSHVKEAHRIDPELRWSYIDPTVKLETYKILESATEHLLPLKVCLEYWGAHVLISNFWVKRKKYNKKPMKDTPSPTTKKPDISPFSIPFLTNQ